MSTSLPAFRACWWLRNPHLQTVLATRFKPRGMRGEPERLELEDGDFIDLIWYGQGDHKPVVLILHGLEGSENSHYVRSIVPALVTAEFRVVFMFHRGCSHQHNRLARSYHSGETGDMAAVMAHILTRTGRPLHAAVGYSLGANALLKYLGEQGEAALPTKAVAVSPPFDLYAACRKLDSGLSRIYQRYLVDSLVSRYRDKFRNRPAPLDVEIDKLRDFYSFDDQVTAVLNGFDGALDYYTRSSCGPYLQDIRTPCLIVHAADDPFLPESALPSPEGLPAQVELLLCRRGGHVGFLEGGLRPRRWLDRLVPTYLKQSWIGSTERRTEHQAAGRR